MALPLLSQPLLSAITNCACPGPNGGRVGIYWGGGDTPYIAPTTSSIRAPQALTDIAQHLLLFLPSWDIAAGRGWVRGDHSPYLGWTSFLMRSTTSGGIGILPTFVRDESVFTRNQIDVYKKSDLSEMSVFTRNHSFSRRSPSRPVVHFLPVE